MSETEIKEIIEAAENGDFQAQHKLGTMYESGEGVPLDKEKAEEWYNKSADQGYDMAMLSLLRMV